MNWATLAAIYFATLGVLGFSCWLVMRSFTAYEKEIERLYGDNKDLRDRMFQSKAMPPSGVDLTGVYEERKQQARDHKDHSGKHVPAGPLERITEKWKDKDLKAAADGVDYTESKHGSN